MAVAGVTSSAASARTESGPLVWSCVDRHSMVGHGSSLYPEVCVSLPFPSSFILNFVPNKKFIRLIGHGKVLCSLFRKRRFGWLTWECIHKTCWTNRTCNKFAYLASSTIRGIVDMKMTLLWWSCAIRSTWPTMCIRSACRHQSTRPLIYTTWNVCRPDGENLTTVSRTWHDRHKAVPHFESFYYALPLSKQTNEGRKCCKRCEFRCTTIRCVTKRTSTSFE